MPNEGNVSGNTRDLLYVLFRHKWSIVTFIVVLVGIVGMRALLAPDAYESEAKIVLTGRKDSTVQMLTGVTSSNELNTETELLNSRGFAEAVVQRVGWQTILTPPDPPEPEGTVGTVKYFLDQASSRARLQLQQWGALDEPDEGADPEERQQTAIELFESSLLVSSEARSDVLNVTYTSATAELAQQILEKTISIYLEKHLAIHATPISLQQLTVETNRLSDELVESERRLEAFLETLGEGSIEQQTDLAVARIRELQSQIERTEAQISGARATIANTSGDLQLRAQERDARIRLQSLTAELAVLRRQFGDARQNLSRLNEAQRRVEELRAEVNGRQDQFSRFQARLEEARIAQTLESEEISNVSVMQSPTFNRTATGSGMQVVMIAALLSLIFGVGLAFLLEYFDHSVRTPEDTLRKLGLRTIASIPLLNTKRIRRLLRREVRRRRRQTDSIVVVPLRLADHVITWENFLPEVRQSFDELRGSLLSGINGNGSNPMLVAVTSCQRHEGVSTVAAGLASAVALAGGEDVLLVNANSHHPDFDIVPGEFRPPHLYEIDARNHMLMAAKPNPFHFEDALTTMQVESVLEQRTLDNMLLSVQDLRYRAVIMDLPSMREGGTPVIHAARADATILVVESERIKREVVQRARSRIEDAGGRVIGIVLNRRKYYIPRWLYARS